MTNTINHDVLFAKNTIIPRKAFYDTSTCLLMKKLLVLIVLFVLLATISQANSDRRKPHDYAELVAWYQVLEAKYPNYIDVFKANERYGLGQLDGGYDLYYVRVTNESSGFLKPEVLFLGGPHGDETVGTVGLYWTTQWLMSQIEEGNEWIEWLLSNREIYIEISHNPYGFDYNQRGDANDWDLNREADFDWRGQNSELWGSTNGQTLYHFINNHAIRVASDFHGGARALLYPWSSTHDDVTALSPFSGKTYTHVPPDFNFFHAASLRLGEYIGNYGGRFDEDNVGTIPDALGYEAPGALASWGYGANIKNSPVEDIFVDDEIYGNYEGCGILWISPEMSTTKDPSDWTFGTTYYGYIAEVLRFVLHQTDIAQPYIRWAYPLSISSIMNDTVRVAWQIYGSLVVDETYITYSFNDDFSNTENGISHNEYDGAFKGGTYWDGVIWEEILAIPNGEKDLYVQAHARVDGAYANVTAPEIYGQQSYLRIVRERTDTNYEETLQTEDGNETFEGQLWWHSPVLHLKMGGITFPREGYLYVLGHEIGKLPSQETIILGSIDLSVSGSFDRVEFYIDGILMHEDSAPPFTWSLHNVIGHHIITARMYDGDEVNEDSISAFLFVK